MEVEMEVMTAPAAPVVALIAPPLLVLGLGDLGSRVMTKGSLVLPTN